MQLRYYQRDAVDSLWKYLSTNDGNPLIILPTGTGKSLVMAQIIEEALASYSQARIIVATHVRELVSQDYAEFINLSPFAPAGIYSAGLNRRDHGAQILFAGIQSVYNKAYKLQRCDLLIIDEAHTVPQKGSGMWLKFIAELKKINPDVRIIGLTATDYRLDSGLLTTGENKIFDDVCYEYGLLDAIKDGYLCPVVPKTMATEYDLSKVGTLAGEYKQNELEAAVNIDTKTKAALDEVESYGFDRKSWLIFACGNAHANAIHQELTRRGYKGAVVTQETSKTERDKAVSNIRNGSIRYLCNNKVFTTGFNAKNIDLIADLAPTKSAGLHVQKLGRSMRCLGVDIAESIVNGKPNAVLLDFARNVEYHGPLDKIRGKDKNSSGDGDAPMKVCPECHQVCFAGLSKCFACGYEFPGRVIDIRTHGGSSAVLSTQIEPEWHKVTDIRYDRHEKEGKTPSMKVSYYTLSAGIQREWVCFEHTGFARKKAEAWHFERLYNVPVPKTVDEALSLRYPKVSEILVKPDGKYSRIIEYEFIEEDEEENDYAIPF